MKEMPPPVLQALVLADHIYTVEGVKRIICGTFSRLWCEEYPTEFGRPTWAFVLLVDCNGEVAIQLRFVRLRDNRVLMQSATINMESKDPLIPIDIAVQVPPFPLPEAGAYSMECYANDQLIGSVRLQAMKAGES